MSAQTRQPTFFITHGGGPSFWMEYPQPIGPHGFDGLRDYLAALPASLPERPKAYLVISGHWEERVPTVSTAPAPSMLYDYYGFPKHAYELSYPAPGSPELARRVGELLNAAGIAYDTDSKRGFDHGVFVPFLIIDPEAEIPVVMLSMNNNFDPADHLQLGAALAPLRDEGVVIIGSGSSFHNLRTYFDGVTEAAAGFDDWLTETATADDVEVRNQRLIDWQQAPYARQCHPREEHLIPLMVAAGAAGNGRGQRVFHDVIGRKPFSGYRFD